MAEMVQIPGQGQVPSTPKKMEQTERKERVFCKSNSRSMSVILFNSHFPAWEDLSLGSVLNTNEFNTILS